MSEETLVTRRSFFHFAATAALSLPFILKAADKCPAVPPKGKTLAKPTEGMGKTLQYVEDAKTSKSPKFKTGSHCGNCKFYNAAKEDSGHAPCTMMGMKFVTNCGWCVSYAVKA